MQFFWLLNVETKNYNLFQFNHYNLMVFRMTYVRVTIVHHMKKKKGTKNSYFHIVDIQLESQINKYLRQYSKAV